MSNHDYPIVPEWVSLSKAAAMAGITEAEVLALVHTGQVRHRWPGKRVLIELDSLADWLDRRDADQDALEDAREADSGENG